VAKYTVRKGRRYRATSKLTGLKRLASNETIAGVLRAAGFAEVKVEVAAGHAMRKRSGQEPMRRPTSRRRSSRSRRSALPSARSPG
jgi:hypothetical protein